MHKGINATMSYYFPSPPDMKALIYYITHYVVCKTKYCWGIYKLAVSYTPKLTMQKQPWNEKNIGTNFWLKLNSESTC